MVRILGEVNVSEAVNGRGVSGIITWDSGSEVCVEITGNAGYGAQAYWRITGTNSAGDYGTHYISTTSDSYRTFEAENGHKYAFQAVWGDEGGVSDGDIFTVNFSSDSGGDDSGGDIETSPPDAFTLNVTQGEGTTVTIVRTWSVWSENVCKYDETTGELMYGANSGLMYENGELYDSVIYYGDNFEIMVKAASGYDLDYYKLDANTVEFSSSNLTFADESGQVISDNVYTLSTDGNVSISTTATFVPAIQIEDGSSWDAYTAYIDNGSGWDVYVMHIDNGSGWTVCG